ncbi:MAG: O-antigen ligase family protein [Gallionellaceae bacterium]
MGKPTVISSLPKYLAIALGISIPISVALDNLLMFLLAMLFLPFGLKSYWNECTINPAARAGIVLFTALLTGCLWGAGGSGAALDTLGKYVDLAFIPIYLVVFRDETTRRAALSAFFGMMLLTLALSIMVGHGLIPVYRWMNVQTSSSEPTIFHGYIAQNYLMAFAAFLFILRLVESKSAWTKWGYAVLAALAAYDVLFLVSARTGPLVLFSLLGYLGWLWASKGLGLDLKKIGIAMAATMAVILMTYHFSARFQDRIALAVKEVKKWDAQKPADINDSMGLRMEFYYQTFQIIAAHPLFGVGTGGFAKAYSDRAAPRGMHEVQNPHNEYLLIMAQLGIIGLLLLLFLFHRMWKGATLIKSEFHRNAARGLMLSTALVSLFNSPLLDHTEGLFFAFMSALFFAGAGQGKKSG